MQRVSPKTTVNGKVKPTEFDRIRVQSVKTWTCPCCLDQLKAIICEYKQF